MPVKVVEQLEAVLVGQIEVDHQRGEILLGIGLAGALATGAGHHLEAEPFQVLAVVLALQVDVLHQQQVALSLQAAAFQVLEHLLQVLAGNGLDQVAGLVLVPVLGLGHAGDDVHRGGAVIGLAAQAAVDLPAADIGQQDVEDDRRETLVLEQADRLLAAAAVDAGEAVGLGFLGYHRGEVDVVFDYQHRGALATA
ncbi:hypothetical protein D9M68_470160 [compost metagenome]